jgi:superoxide reductase
MTKKNEVYKCTLCGNIVEVLHVGAGELVCCGQSDGADDRKHR